MAPGSTPRAPRPSAPPGTIPRSELERRASRWFSWLDELAQDARFGLRMLRRYPVLSLTVIVTLGLGIGLTSTVFNITNGFLHKPLPFHESDRIMVLGETSPNRNVGNRGVNVADFIAWRDQQSSFERMGAFSTMPVDLALTRGRPERVPGGSITSGILEILQVQPILGRAFRSDEERPGAAPVVIIGYDLWQTRFQGDPDAIGRMVEANGVRRTVIGVMPKGFEFPGIEQVWLPIEIDPSAARREDEPRYSVLARLRDGVSSRQAGADVAAIASRLEREFPSTNGGVAPTMRTLKRALVPAGYYGLFYTMLLAAFGVLLIGCANVASLLLARASARTHEIAVRQAIGAGRARLIRQLVIEALVLALFGGGIGLGLGQLGLRWFTRQLFDVMAAVGQGEIPFWIHFEYDVNVLFFVLGITVFSGAIAAIVPAIRTSTPAAVDAMKDRSSSSTLRMGRLFGGLVITEAAAACVLLVLAGLMIQSVIRMTTDDRDYSTEKIFTSWISLPDTGVPASRAGRDVYEELLPRIEAIPGVISATMSDGLPPYRSGAWTVEIEGRTYPTDNEYPIVRRGIITPDYFRTFEVPIIQGRAFSGSDDRDAPRVVIVNASFVEAHLSGASPLGRRIRVRGNDTDARWMTIVGVVPDLKALPQDPQGTESDAHHPACFYVPMKQSDIGQSAVIAIRTQGPPMAITPDVRSAVAAVGADATLYRVLSMDGVILRMTWFYPVFGKLFMMFGLASLFLAAIGLYGMMSFAVTRRTQELGIRLALGATADRLVWMVMGKNLLQMGIGLSIGLVLAVFAAERLKVLLYEIDALPVAMVGIVVATLAVTGLLATFVPARRVTQIDPMTALTPE